MPPYPYVEFTLSIGTWDTGGEAYPDTGFEGALTMPVGLAREILADPDTTSLELADGTIRDFPAWSGVLTLEDREFQVEVVAIGTQFLIGREVLDQLEICFRFGREVKLQFRDGQRS